MQADSKAFALRRPFHQLGHAVEQFAQVEAGGLELQLVGLEFRVVENVVDDALHLLRRQERGAHELGVVRCQRRVHQQVEHRRDAVERRADLVAHRRQELALGHHGRFGGVLGLAQFLFELGALFELTLQFTQRELVLAQALVGGFEFAHALVQAHAHRDRGQHREQREHQGDRLPGAGDVEGFQRHGERGARRGPEGRPAKHQGRRSPADDHGRQSTE